MIRISGYRHTALPPPGGFEPRRDPCQNNRSAATSPVSRGAAALATAACGTLLAACGGGSKDMTTPPPPPQPVASFTVQPKYFIASVLYMPPGPASMITYGGGTALGTTVATAGSWSGAARAGVQTGRERTRLDRHHSGGFPDDPRR